MLSAARFFRQKTEKRAKPIDSGWQILRGDETDDELASTDVVVIWSLGTLADRYPQLETLLASDPASGEWFPDHTGAFRPTG